MSSQNTGYLLDSNSEVIDWIAFSHSVFEVVITSAEKNTIHEILYQLLLLKRQISILSTKHSYWFLVGWIWQISRLIVTIVVSIQYCSLYSNQIHEMNSPLTCSNIMMHERFLLMLPRTITSQILQDDLKFGFSYHLSHKIWFNFVVVYNNHCQLPLFIGIDTNILNFSELLIPIIDHLAFYILGKASVSNSLLQHVLERPCSQYIE